MGIIRDLLIPGKFEEDLKKGGIESIRNENYVAGLPPLVERNTKEKQNQFHTMTPADQKAEIANVQTHANRVREREAAFVENWHRK